MREINIAVQSARRGEAHLIANTCYLLSRTTSLQSDLYVLLDATVGLSSVFGAETAAQHVSIKIDGYRNAPLRLVKIERKNEQVLQESVSLYRAARKRRSRSQVIAWIRSSTTTECLKGTLERVIDNERRMGSGDPMRVFDSKSVPHWPHAMSRQQVQFVSRSLSGLAFLDFQADLQWSCMDSRPEQAVERSIRNCFNYERVQLINETLETLRKLDVLEVNIEKAHRFAQSIMSRPCRMNMLDRVILLAHALMLDCDFHTSPSISALLNGKPSTGNSLIQTLGRLGPEELDRIRDTLIIKHGAG